MDAGFSGHTLLSPWGRSPASLFLHVPPKARPEPDAMRLQGICPLSCVAGDKMGMRGQNQRGQMGTWGQSPTSLFFHVSLKARCHAASRHLSPSCPFGDKFVPGRKPDVEPFGDKTGIRGQMRGQNDGLRSQYPWALGTNLSFCPHFPLLLRGVRENIRVAYICRNGDKTALLSPSGDNLRHPPSSST